MGVLLPLFKVICVLPLSKPNQDQYFGQQSVIKKLSTAANNLVANLLTMDNNPVAVMPPLVLVPPVIPTATLLTVAPTTQIDFS